MLRARRLSAEQGRLGGTAHVRKNRMEVLPMAKDVFSKGRRVLPAALVVIGWSVFVAGFLVTEPLTKIGLLCLARVLP